MNEKIRALGIADHVRRTAAYRQEEAPAIYRSAHILLHSKYKDPCPTVPIEAMACGLPVLASNFSALPEVVADSETGTLVAPGDVNAWTSGLADLLADPSRRQRMGAAARVRAETKFTWMACARELEAVLLGG